jgi:hypothetical protein
MRKRLGEYKIAVVTMHSRFFTRPFPDRNKEQLQNFLVLH